LKSWLVHIRNKEISIRACTLFIDTDKIFINV
jgi:hypothetical protein